MKSAKRRRDVELVEALRRFAVKSTKRKTNFELLKAGAADSLRMVCGTEHYVHEALDTLKHFEVLFPALGKLVQEGLRYWTDRMEVCEKCEEGYLRRRKDQKTCGKAACRQKVGTYPERHRLYMRWRYQHEAGKTKLSFDQWLEQVIPGDTERRK